MVLKVIRPPARSPLTPTNMTIPAMAVPQAMIGDDDLCGRLINRARERTSRHGVQGCGPFLAQSGNHCALLVTALFSENTVLRLG